MNVHDKEVYLNLENVKTVGEQVSYDVNKMEETLDKRIIDHDFYEVKQMQGKYCSSYHEIKVSDAEMNG